MANFTYRANVSPLRGEKPIFGLLSKTIPMPALRAGLPVIILIIYCTTSHFIDAGIIRSHVTVYEFFACLVLILLGLFYCLCYSHSYKRSSYSALKRPRLFHQDTNRPSVGTVYQHCSVAPISENKLLDHYTQSSGHFYRLLDLCSQVATSAPV